MKGKIINILRNNRMIFNVLMMMIICFISSTIISIRTISNVVNNENQNVTTLIANNIYSEIYAELQKDVVVGKTMSASSELQDILLHEQEYSTEEMEQLIKQVLGRYTEVLGCNTAFLISTSTNRYYTQDGFNKIVDVENDEHDIWFKIFLESGEDHGFDIDVDEAHGSIWTVFINNRIYDDNGNLIGVCGIGTQMVDMQDILKQMQDSYDISVSIVDKNGVVQVDMDDMNIDKAYYNLIDLDIDYDSEDIHYVERNDDYIVTKYMKDLEWTLLIQRHVDIGELVFVVVAKSILVMTIIFLIFLVITTFVVNHENKAIKQGVMLDSYGKLADIYDAMYLINIKNDSVREIKNVFDGGRKLFDVTENFSSQVEILAENFISDKYRDRVEYFFDFSNVTKRFARRVSNYIEVTSNTQKWYRLRLVAVKNPNKNVVDHVIFLIEDIDEERRKEENLRLETASARAANDAKGKFLANMSHEIRTPINAVLGMDTMILRESNEQQIREYAMTIQNAGNTLLSLINDILDISKIESGKMEIVPAKYDLPTLIYDVMNMIDMKAQKKGLELNLIVDSSLPSGLYGDDVRIRQIIVNLMSNAVKYTEKGSVTLVISGKTQGDSTNLSICVRDTGIGIKKNDLDRLFEDFTRIEEVRNRNIEGTGLGIGITVQLLKLMNSKLEVDSVYGEGSQFSFVIKQKVVNEEPIGDIRQRISQIADNYEYNSLFIAPDARVLVVDDNQVNRIVFSSLLKETEIAIDEAESGKKALELISKNLYDIIFLDHMMPDMDGIEVLRNIRSTSTQLNVNTPVIVLTANAISGAKEEYIAAGFNDYLSKPIIPENLERMIEKLLPASKKKDGERKKAQNKSSITDFELPSIEGIDWYYAQLHLNNKEALLSTLKNFTGTIELEAENLKNIYDSLIKDFENKDLLDSYRVKVHAMKSTATLLGFVPIAGMAAALEFAARDGRVDVIRDITDHFIVAWCEYKEKLKFITEDIGEKQEITDVSAIIQNINELKTAIQDFDVHRADSALEQIRKYKYNSDLENIIKKLPAAVTNLDVDLVVNICDSILGLLE